MRCRFVDAQGFSFDSGYVTKVSDSEVTAQQSFYGASVGAGTCQLVDAVADTPYTNTVPFTITEPVGILGRLDTVTPAVWEYGVAFDPVLDGDFPFPGGDASPYYAFVAGVWSTAPVTVVSAARVTAHFEANWSQVPGASTIEIRNQSTGESFTNALPINLTS
jgi:hypothetical protein